jgi:hypothetical protein
MRKLLVAAHVVVGVGWLGITAAKLVLEVITATTARQDVAGAGFTISASPDRLV